MNLGNIGNWSSIIGLVITIFTFFLAANVNKILKSKSDKVFFTKRVDGLIDDLKYLQEIAGKEKPDILYATQKYSKINTAINVVNSSWSALLPYDNRFMKIAKVISWKHRFKKIQRIYNRRDFNDVNKVMKFLDEFITFMEKEKCNNEREV